MYMCMCAMCICVCNASISYTKSTAGVQVYTNVPADVCVYACGPELTPRVAAVSSLNKLGSIEWLPGTDPPTYMYTQTNMYVIQI